jgi:hypothetical protein
MPGFDAHWGYSAVLGKARIRLYFPMCAGWGSGKMAQEEDTIALSKN